MGGERQCANGGYATAQVRNVLASRRGQFNVAATAHKVMGGERVVIKPPEGSGARFLGPSKNNPAGDWTYHEVVINSGRVYESFTGPNGMPVDEYKAQFDYSDALNFGF